MSDAPPCDPEIFKNGMAVCTFAAPTRITEPWVIRVREKSGQRVDWHYSGGRVNVLYIGDYAKVKATVEELLPELDAACREDNEKQYGLGEYGSGLCFFPEESRGLYRQGDPTPPGAIAAFGGSFIVGIEQVDEDAS